MDECKTSVPSWQPDYEFDPLVEGPNGKLITLGQYQGWIMRESKYAEQIQAQLVAWSKAANYEEAVLEWRYTGNHHANGGQCELCGNTNLIYMFEIANEHTRQHHWLGSECIENYRIAGHFLVGEHRKQMEKRRKLEADTRLLEEAAKHSPWVAKNLADLNKKLRKYGSLTPKVRAICQKRGG